MSVDDDADRKSAVDGRNWRIAEWFPDLDAEQQDKLRVFHFELLHFNGRMNLISPKTERSADLIHFSDCIIAAKEIFKWTDKRDFYDIGAGNGLPGLIMAILEPECKMTLVDSDGRKVQFLKHMIHRLELKNAQAEQVRLEDLPEGSIKNAISRGFANISRTLLYARKAAAENCEYFHMKGDGWSREVAEMPSQILAYWDPQLVKEYVLPNNETRLSIVITKRNPGR